MQLFICNKILSRILVVDGEIQVDFALNPEMIKVNFRFLKIAGKKVNTLYFFLILK
jgi:phosphotransacetylase